MSIFRNTIPLMSLLIISSCFSKPPTRTARPELETPPWEELVVTSKDSGQSYNYMYAAGPSPDSPAIVLLHGGFFDQRMWLNMLELNSVFNVYAMEWPDASPYYTGQTSDYGKVVEDFVGAVNIDELFIGGVSNGVYGAIEYTIANPGKVKALFLFSSVMFGISEAEVEKRTGLASKALGFDPDKLQRIIEWKIGRTDLGLAPGKIQLDDIFYTRPYSYYDQIFSAAVNQGSNKQATDTVHCPVLLLHGTNDETMPVEVSKLSLGVFLDADFKEFRDQPHSFVFTFGEKLVPVVFNFLKKRNLLNH